MIIVTGAAGFIGSALINKLNNKGYKDIIPVDDFSNPLKMKNLENKSCLPKIHRDDFLVWLEKNHKDVDCIFHLGARTDTAEFDTQLLNTLNLFYSQHIWDACVAFGIPLIYASSAATYGAGELGYDDDHSFTPLLKPLNPYGVSKNEFDKYVLTQPTTPPKWVGLKFFNVYGPNEYHKGRMASVVLHAFHQIRNTGNLKLFKSHRNDFEDGKQLRDFIYVKDLVEVCLFCMEHQPDSGIYNLGTGTARSFFDLGRLTFEAMNLPVHIDFIDIPEDIRDKYQYYTCAKMDKLLNSGYKKGFHSLENGITDYVQTYLQNNLYY